MFMSIEHLEHILIAHFNCSRVTANIVANLIADYDMKVEEERSSKHVWNLNST